MREADSLTILLVDDDRVVQRQLGDRLEKERWRVLTEKDGEWAVRACQRRCPDAIILDLLIPGMSGYQVVEAVRAMPQGRDVAIIMMTGVHRGPRYRAQAVERYGLLEFLVKPVDPEAVVATLRRYFASRPTSSPPPPAEPLPPLDPPTLPMPPATRAGESTETGPTEPGATDAGQDTETENTPADIERLVDDQKREERREVEVAASKFVSPLALGTVHGEPPRPAAPPVAGATSSSGDGSQSNQDLTPPHGVPAALIAATVADPAPAYRGTLARTPLPELLAMVQRKRLSGAIFLLRDRVKKIVYLRDGRPTYIKSNLLEDCLGRVLVRERMITEKECEESVRRMKAQKRQQGAILIEMNVISPHNLRYGLELQLQSKLFDVFRWVEGQYVFRADVHPPAEIIELDFPLARLIYEGVQRSYSDERLRAALHPYLPAKLAHSNDPEARFQDLGLSAAEETFLARFDGSRTAAELLAGCDVLPIRDAMVFTYALAASGIITSSPSAPLRAAPQPVAPTRVPGWSLPAAPPPAAPPSAAPPSAAPPSAAPPSAAPPSGASWSPPAAAVQPTTPPPPPRQPGSPQASADRASVARPGGLRPGAALGALGAARRNAPLWDDALLAAFLSERRGADPFRVLGLAPTVSDDDLEEAFATLARGLHPDRYRGHSETTSRLAREAFELVVAAHRELSDPHRRWELGTAAAAVVPETADPASRALAADRAFQQGLAHLRVSSFAPAEASFQQAVSLRPDMGRYHAYLGWAYFCARDQAPEAAAGALGILGRAAELSPALEEAHYFLGLVYSAIDRLDLAEAELGKAVQCNPDSEDALRELRLLQSQRLKP